MKSVKSLMADNHRREILAAIPPNGSAIEWGCGGTTKWLLDRLSPGQRLTTVEHHAGWASTAKQACGNPPNWMPLVRPGLLEVGANATHWEECPAGLTDYIWPADLSAFDVFLVDGVARGACLAAVALAGRPGARVFLHDAGRSDWYAWACRADRFGEPWVIPADKGDYPPPLWSAVLR